ncbi:MAG: helix-hairpin-helix domain-containing protein [Bacteroidetes bacterium]|nr:helix-hairpin-helix domain-containing protein [Bacteroidota bacterium]
MPKSINAFVARLRNIALKFFTPQEYRAVLLFIAAGLAVLCWRAGRTIVTRHIPLLRDSAIVAATHRNDSLFALLSRKDFVRDSLEFWMPAESLGIDNERKMGGGLSKKERDLTAGCISLNGSSADSLALLPGIGKAMAARIVAYRTERGRFRRLSEIMNIHGVGEKTYERIVRYLRLN